MDQFSNWSQFANIPPYVPTEQGNKLPYQLDNGCLNGCQLQNNPTNRFNYSPNTYNNENLKGCPMAGAVPSLNPYKDLPGQMDNSQYNLYNNGNLYNQSQ